MMGAIYGLEILQTPKIIAISSEFKAGTRRIWMDEKRTRRPTNWTRPLWATRLADGRVTCSWSIP